MSDLRFSLDLLILSSGWLLAIVFCGLFMQAKIADQTKMAMLVFWSHSILETMGRRNAAAREMAVEIVALATGTPHRTLLELEESFEEGGDDGKLVSISQIHRG